MFKKVKMYAVIREDEELNKKDCNSFKNDVIAQYYADCLNVYSKQKYKVVEFTKRRFIWDLF